jgi:metal-responsive CopG/Arc/MetJ family transcriptional regulator
MAKINVSLDEDVRDDLFRLVAPRKRSRVINEALRRELIRRKREAATEKLHQLRRRSAKFSGGEIVAALRKDRARSA